MPDIRDELRALRDFSSKYEETRERIARLRSAMEGLNRVMRNSPDSHAVPTDKLAKQMAELDKLERQLAEDVIDYERRVRALEGRLATLPVAQRRVMELRYIRGLKWKAVAKKVGYSVDNCFKLHRKALETWQ